jgi:DNA polymerase-1
MKTSRLLIDGDILTYRTCWACQTQVQWEDDVVTTATNLKEVRAQADAMIAYWQEQLGVEQLVICFSPKGGKYFRHNILESYKGTRKASQKPMGYHSLVEYLKEKYSYLQVPMLEADDTLGILATNGEYSRNIIVSVDKDMLTIPCEYYNMDKEVTETVDTKLADYMHLYQTLVGDSTDNYKGCPGVGPKKAADILKIPSWSRVVTAFEKAGLTPDDALVQARVARILRANEYNFETGEVILWEPLNN